LPDYNSDCGQRLSPGLDSSLADTIVSDSDAEEGVDANFEPEQIYHRRNELHGKYGGQQQGGISTPSSSPIIMLFSGSSGEQYGYKDGWNQDGTFPYSGEGQIGDMQLTRGNAAIAKHEESGKSLHLFQMTPEKGLVRYVGEMRYLDHHRIPRAADREGRSRAAIVFRLQPVSRAKR
jgi:5-methylcytosine-specific restriction protein A